MTLSFFFKVIPSRTYLADLSLETLSEISWRIGQMLGPASD